MINALFRSTALLGALFALPAAQAATTSPESILAVPQLKIGGQTSFNSSFFQNDRKTLFSNKDRTPCSIQRYSRANLFTVDNSRIKFNVDGKTDPGMDYGLVFVLDGDTNATKNVREAYIYTKGSWGTIYGGDTYGVTNLMSFGGFSEWGGTGFLDGGVLDRTFNYTTGAMHSIDLVGEPSRDTKLTYLTPRWKGIQVGVSYTPRTEHRGQEQVNSWTSYKNPKEPFDTESIASGINFIHTFTSGFEMALSATSVFGNTHSEYKTAPARKDTAGFAFGGDFKYQGWGFGAEYGNNTKSQQLTRYGKPNAGQFLDFGLSYTWGATKLSTGYYYGWRKALGQRSTIVSKCTPSCSGRVISRERVTNGAYVVRRVKTNAVSAAIDHKLTPGFGVYFEYAHIQMKNPIAGAEGALTNKILGGCGQFKGVTKSNKANAFIVGSRLVF